MDLFNKVHIFEPVKVHTCEPNIRLIRLFSLMLNYANPESYINELFVFVFVMNNICRSDLYGCDNGLDMRVFRKVDFTN